MRKIIIVICLFTVNILLAQNTINAYEYVIVPTQYSFQKTANKYDVNALTKFLFYKIGFKAYLSSDQLPVDLANNRCKALTANVVASPTLLNTRAFIQLVDCQNKEIFKTKLGKSKLKDFKRAYYEAIRNAFVEIEHLNYHYNPQLSSPKSLAIEAKKPEVIKTDKKVVSSKIISKPKIIKESIQQKTFKKKKETESVKSMANFNIEGRFQIGDYGLCEIKKTNLNWILFGGDEQVEIGNIYPTSNDKWYILKWKAFKQPQLIKIDELGNLLIDSKNGFKTYKRVH